MDKTKYIICGCAYRHPNTDISIFTNYISKCLRKINKENKLCYLSGNFNIDLLKYDSSNKHRDFLNMMTSSGFLPPHIIHPTRITDYTSTIIDNIYSNNFEDNSTGGNILIQFADHLSQFLCIDKYVERRKPIDIFKRNYSNFDENKFIDDIAIQDWNSNNNTNIYFDNFLTTLENCLEKHAPMKKLNKKQIKKIDI